VRAAPLGIGARDVNTRPRARHPGISRVRPARPGVAAGRAGLHRGGIRHGGTCSRGAGAEDGAHL